MHCLIRKRNFEMMHKIEFAELERFNVTKFYDNLDKAFEFLAERSSSVVSNEVDEIALRECSNLEISEVDRCATPVLSLKAFSELRSDDDEILLVTLK